MNMLGYFLRRKSVKASFLESGLAETPFDQYPPAAQMKCIPTSRLLVKHKKNRGAAAENITNFKDDFFWKASEML